MDDLLFLAVVVVCFLGAASFVQACAWVAGRADASPEHHETGAVGGAPTDGLAPHHPPSAALEQLPVRRPVDEGDR